MGVIFISIVVRKEQLLLIIYLERLTLLIGFGYDKVVS